MPRGGCHGEDEGMKRRGFPALIGGALFVLFCASPACAQKAADTLRVTWRDAVPNVDPYYNTLRAGLVLAHHVWDCLVDRDPDTFQIKPLLATSWRQVDGTTIDFTLRQGVTFQDGSPFSADDVVYTINTVISDKQVSVPSNYSYLAGAEKIDELHVRVKLKRVFPAALEYLAMTLPIWPKAYRQQVGADGYARAPIGTGPYRITRIDGASEIDLERYDNYFPNGPKGKPAIRFIRIAEVADASAELAALLDGQADWIWNFNPDQFENIASQPTLQALRSESMRVAYLSMDAAGRTGADNPLTKLAVRQAIAHAINRQSIARQLVQGASRVLDAPCYPTQFGCDVSMAVRYSYDPAKSKQLLADAGYPNGFSTELVTFLLPQWVEAIQNYLQAVGIFVRVTQLQTNVAVQRSMSGQNPLYLASWGSYSINDVSAFLPYFFSGGDEDYTRDPKVEKLVEKGGSTVDPDERRDDYAQAIHIITANADFLPLFTFVTTYGISRSLNFKPYPDELPRFYLSSWR
jgi:peptide/nickel transport system substrate-binding protein